MNYILPADDYVGISFWLISMALVAAKAQRLEVYINSHQRMLDHLKHVVELIDQEI